MCKTYSHFQRRIVCSLTSFLLACFLLLPSGADAMARVNDAVNGVAGVELDSVKGRIVPLKQLDVRPEFPGGREALLDYVEGYFANDSIGGRPSEYFTVAVCFVVEPDGRITGARVKDTGMPGIDGEVVAMLEQMPRWTPGRKDGRAVRTGYGARLRAPDWSKPVIRRDTMHSGKVAEAGKVRVDAEFPGGKELFKKYMDAKINYPELSSHVNRSGQVVVRFTVEKDGRVTSPEIIRHGTADMDAEILRFIGAMPRWNPATVDGRAVRQRYTLTINFNAHETAFTKYDADDNASDAQP